ncbi:hypothetical protein BFW01_g6172 [Lasiodiplodia theobromae]|uniref:Uncharacterized protein n=1 Tax=Lasiodiplodia theobromae TaxID=45133 RepID=A0A5N5DN93_9PEZI|nr:uncharacterized protein LTHEOB_7977 [Lasiodiplodia theobromae]KAB2579406.1 hypothetical protein DBV05_g2042 [Lasiodiplodia theobromae]KAF4542295.1 hypothetical protein LTHEOB_7977 [Lasiodiplodia theobromae]KAF9635277.1 hypothetical protein BFW01_g6172 [Lasiodiplodia theobromae]
MASITVLRAAYTLLVVLAALQVLLPLVIAQDNLLSGTTINSTAVSDVNGTEHKKKKKPDNYRDQGGNCYNCTIIENGGVAGFTSPDLVTLGLSLLTFLFASFL